MNLIKDITFNKSDVQLDDSSVLFLNLFEVYQYNFEIFHFFYCLHLCKMEDLKILHKEYKDLNNNLFRGGDKLIFNVDQIIDLCKNKIYGEKDDDAIEQYAQEIE